MRMFDKMNMFFLCFTVLVTLSKGGTYVSDCIKLLPVRVLKFETLTALTIMLEV